MLLALLLVEVKALCLVLLEEAAPVPVLGRLGEQIEELKRLHLEAGRKAQGSRCLDRQPLLTGIRGHDGAIVETETVLQQRAEHGDTTLVQRPSTFSWKFLLLRSGLDAQHMRTVCNAIRVLERQ